MIKCIIDKIVTIIYIIIIGFFGILYSLEIWLNGTEEEKARRSWEVRT